MLQVKKEALIIEIKNKRHYYQSARLLTGEYVKVSYCGNSKFIIFNASIEPHEIHERYLKDFVL